MSSKQVPWWREPTKDQWAAFLAAWSGWVMDAFDFTIFFLVMSDIGAEFGVGKVALSASVTLTLLARLPGGFLAGILADRVGRRLPLMLSILGFSICSGLVAISPSFAAVLVVRMLFGLFMGAEWTAGTTLAMENWPARSRGIASGILQGSWAIGYLLAGPVHDLVVPMWGWRGLFAVAAIPALLIFPIRLFVKESEEWRKPKEKQKAIPLRELTRIPGWTTTMGWSTLVMICGFGVYYSLVPHYPTLLKEQGLGASVTTMTSWFNIGMLIGAVACGWVAARHGVVLAICAPALLMIPALPLYLGAVDELFPLGAFLGGVLGVGYAGVCPLLLTSLFAPEVRARSVGLVYHIGAIPASFVTTLVAAISESTSLTLAQSIALASGSLLLCQVVAIIVAMARVRPAQRLVPTADSWRSTG